MYNSEIYIIWILFFFLLFFFYQFVTTRVYTLFEQCVNFGGVGDSEKHLDLMQRERESERAAHIIQQHDPIASQQHRAEKERDDAACIRHFLTLSGGDQNSQESDIASSSLQKCNTRSRTTISLSTHSSQQLRKRRRCYK